MQQALDKMCFHDKTTTPSTGSEYNVTKASTVNIEFETESAFSATIEAKVNNKSAIWKPIMVADLATLDLSTTVTNAGHIYQIDVTGITALRVNLTSVGGEISVYGMCVA